MNYLYSIIHSKTAEMITSKKKSSPQLLDYKTVSWADLSDVQKNEAIQQMKFAGCVDSHVYPRYKYQIYLNDGHIRGWIIT